MGDKAVKKQSFVQVVRKGEYKAIVKWEDSDIIGNKSWEQSVSKQYFSEDISTLQTSFIHNPKAIRTVERLWNIEF